MERLSQILPKVLQSNGLKHHADAALVLHRARAWIAEYLPNIRTSVTPRSMQEDGTLLIECEDSAAARQCLDALPHLKVFLREECGFLPVRTIRLVRTRKHA
ncbi:MAG: DciA family protein [Candidatus Peribacteraceae bacterium]|nr:DciA family protein [Candidatus Peribacteraceae bacterium]MDD5739952.1 DciA family protein [Candidatus Peribacteraceae bacterium]